MAAMELTATPIATFHDLLIDSICCGVDGSVYGATEDGIYVIEPEAPKVSALLTGECSRRYAAYVLTARMSTCTHWI